MQTSLLLVLAFVGAVVGQSTIITPVYDVTSMYTNPPCGSIGAQPCQQQFVSSTSSSSPIVSSAYNNGIVTEVEYSTPRRFTPTYSRGNGRRVWRTRYVRRGVRRSFVAPSPCVPSVRRRCPQPLQQQQKKKKKRELTAEVRVQKDINYKLKAANKLAKAASKNKRVGYTQVAAQQIVRAHQLARQAKAQSGLLNKVLEQKAGGKKLKSTDLKVSQKMETDRKSKKFVTQKIKKIAKSIRKKVVVSQAPPGMQEAAKRALKCKGKNCKPVTKKAVSKNVKNEVKRLITSIKKVQKNVKKAVKKLKKSKTKQGKKKAKKAATKAIRVRREAEMLRAVISNDVAKNKISPTQANGLAQNVQSVIREASVDTKIATKVASNAAVAKMKKGPSSIAKKKQKLKKATTKVVKKTDKKSKKAKIKAKRLKKTALAKAATNKPATAARAVIKAVRNAARSVKNAAKARSTAVEAKKSQQQGGMEKIKRKTKRKAAKKVQKALHAAKAVVGAIKKVVKKDPRLKRLPKGTAHRKIDNKLRKAKKQLKRAKKEERQAQMDSTRGARNRAQDKATRSQRAAAKVLKTVAKGLKQIEGRARKKTADKGDKQEIKSLQMIGQRALNVAQRAQRTSKKASKKDKKKTIGSSKKVTGKGSTTRKMKKEVVSSAIKVKSAKKMLTKALKQSRKPKGGKTHKKAKSLDKAISKVATAIKRASGADVEGADSKKKNLGGVALEQKKKEAQKALKTAISIGQVAVNTKSVADMKDKRLNKVQPGPASKKVTRRYKTTNFDLKIAKKKVKEAKNLLGVGNATEAERKAGEAARKAADALKKASDGMQKVEQGKNKDCCKNKDSAGNLEREVELDALAKKALEAAKQADEIMKMSSKRERKVLVPNKAVSRLNAGRMEKKLKVAQQASRKAVKEEKKEEKVEKKIAMQQSSPVFGAPKGKKSQKKKQIKAAKLSDKALKDIGKSIRKTAKVEQQAVLAQDIGKASTQMKNDKKIAMATESQTIITAAKIVVDKAQAETSDVKRNSKALPGKASRKVQSQTKKASVKASQAKDLTASAAKALQQGKGKKAQELAATAEKKAGKALKKVSKAMKKIDDRKKQHVATSGDVKKIAKLEMVAKKTVEQAAKAADVAKKAISSGPMPTNAEAKIVTKKGRKLVFNPPKQAVKAAPVGKTTVKRGRRLTFKPKRIIAKIVAKPGRKLVFNPPKQAAKAAPVSKTTVKRGRKLNFKKAIKKVKKAKIVAKIVAKPGRKLVFNPPKQAVKAAPVGKTTVKRGRKLNFKKAIKKVKKAKIVAKPGRKLVFNPPKQAAKAAPVSKTIVKHGRKLNFKKAIKKVTKTVSKKAKVQQKKVDQTSRNLAVAALGMALDAASGKPSKDADAEIEKSLQYASQAARAALHPKLIGAVVSGIAEAAEKILLTDSAVVQNKGASSKRIIKSEKKIAALAKKAAKLAGKVKKGNAKAKAKLNVILSKALQVTVTELSALKKMRAQRKATNGDVLVAKKLLNNLVKINDIVMAAK